VAGPWGALAGAVAPDAVAPARRGMRVSLEREAVLEREPGVHMYTIQIITERTGRRWLSACTISAGNQRSPAHRDIGKEAIRKRLSTSTPSVGEKPAAKLLNLSHN